MAWFDEMLGELPVAGAQRPYPRLAADAATWRRILGHLSEGHCTLLSLWGEPDAAHLALEAEGRIAVVSLACPDQRFPSVGRVHAPALRLERALADLYGLEPQGSPDRRRWLDHGWWGVRNPLGSPYKA